MAALRIIFMGTPELAATSLRALLREPAFQIVAVVTQPDRPKGRDLKLQPSSVKQLALEADLPVLQPERARDEKFITKLRALQPELIAVAAKKAHRLAIFHDANLPTLAEKVFAEAPVQELRGGSAELAGVREHLRRHLTRSELAAAATRLATLQEKLAGTSGPISIAFRQYVQGDLGNPEVKTERIVATYAELVSEIKRIEALAGEMGKVEELCRRMEFRPSAHRCA